MTLFSMWGDRGSAVLTKRNEKFCTPVLGSTELKHISTVWWEWHEMAHCAEAAFFLSV